MDKKPRIPGSEILTTGTDEEASSVPERVLYKRIYVFLGTPIRNQFHLIEIAEINEMIIPVQDMML